MRDKILVDRARYEQMRQDYLDMKNAHKTVFIRCACGRIAEQGVICPTNQRGGDCEAGA